MTNEVLKKALTTTGTVGSVNCVNTRVLTTGQTLTWGVRCQDYCLRGGGPPLLPQGRLQDPRSLPSPLAGAARERERCVGVRCGERGRAERDWELGLAWAGGGARSRRRAVPAHFTDKFVTVPPPPPPFSGAPHRTYSTEREGRR